MTVLDLEPSNGRPPLTREDCYQRISDQGLPHQIVIRARGRSAPKIVATCNCGTKIYVGRPERPGGHEAMLTAYSAHVDDVVRDQIIPVRRPKIRVTDWACIGTRCRECRAIEGMRCATSSGEKAKRPHSVRVFDWTTRGTGAHLR